jgi:hypothetical protein
MKLRRRKSRGQQAADILSSYLKLKAASKAAKGAKKAAQGTAAYQVAKRTPMVKRLPVIAAAAGVAAVVATKVLRSGNDQTPATA